MRQAVAWGAPRTRIVAAPRTATGSQDDERQDDERDERTETAMTTVQDGIERQITINAPIERVWPLVSEPGWWIGDADPSVQKRSREGEFQIVEDAMYGKFLVRVLGSEEFRYASYRWAVSADEPGAVPDDANSTLVEFWLSELTGGPTLVRVVESGFSALATTEADQRRLHERNVGGWRQQMDILKARAEHVTI
jgi:uncharacterized protein YndB with AHSA1/START domain